MPSNARLPDRFGDLLAKRGRARCPQLVRFASPASRLPLPCPVHSPVHTCGQPADRATRRPDAPAQRRTLGKEAPTSVASRRRRGPGP